MHHRVGKHLAFPRPARTGHSEKNQTAAGCPVDTVVLFHTTMRVSPGEPTWRVDGLPRTAWFHARIEICQHDSRAIFVQIYTVRISQ